MWEVEYTDEFELWWRGLSEQQQIDIVASVELLEQLGPQLSRPHADTIKGSKYTNMKELRTQSKGNPLRTFYVFDPRRSAILLFGGDKTGDDHFYKKMIPLADRLYGEHHLNISKEEFNNG